MKVGWEAIMKHLRILAQDVEAMLIYMVTGY